jgi:hypothetical protein
MRSVHLLAIAVTAASLYGQGPPYRERWGYLHLERRRQEVLAELQGRDHDTRIKVAELLAAADQGVPFRGPARALALLRGVPCDDAFLFRATLCAFVLPEVVDPEAEQTECRGLQLSLTQPFTVPQPFPVRFQVEVTAFGGGRVFAGEIDKETEGDDLRMARAHLEIPCAGLDDGAYELRVAALLDGKEPRATDPRLVHRFHVLRGYQERALARGKEAAALIKELDQPSAALLHGLGAQVGRVYGGEAGDGPSDGVRELTLLETGIANARNGRPVLAGMKGAVTAALPAGGDKTLAVRLRLPEGGGKLPLVLIASGAPFFDNRGLRPTAPGTRGPGWLYSQCEAAFPPERYRFAVLESPGGGFHYADAFTKAVPVLAELLRADPEAVVAVLEREAAVALSFAPDQLAKVRGACLVSGGSLGREALPRVGKLEVLGCALHGHPASDGLRRTAELIAGKYGAVDFSGRFELLSGDDRSWVLGVTACLPEIAAFCERVLRP